MIDLTPLDVRKKRGDFRKMLRGYDPQEVDSFLELVAERLEGLVKETLALKERTDLLAEQVKTQESRERAIQEALVSAQTLREEISRQASREAESVREHSKREASLLVQQAQAESRQLRSKADADVAQMRQQAVGDIEALRRKTEGDLERLTVELERMIEEKTGVIDELERKRTRFLRAFRSLLERELDGVAIEEGKAASEDAILELDLTGGHRRAQARLIESAALDLLASGENTTEPVESIEALAPEPMAEEPEADAPSEPTIEVVPTTATVEEASPERVTLEPDLEDQPAASSDGGELLVDQAFATLDENADAGDAFDEAALDSLVDSVLTDGSEDETVVIPISSLAPARDETDALDDDARAAVNQLFDRDDVPIRASDADDSESDDSWSRLLRGDGGGSGPGASAPENQPRGQWSPNFPDKGRKEEEASGWSGPKDPSRWR